MNYTLEQFLADARLLKKAGKSEAEIREWLDNNNVLADSVETIIESL